MTGPLRVLRQIVAPTGRHRPRRPVLLPDEPITTTSAPVPLVVLDDDELEQLLDNGAIAANEFATCPAEGLRRFHAFYRNGIRKCWTCGESSAGDAITATTTTRGD